MMKMVFGFILGALLSEALLLRTYRQEISAIKEECNQKVIDSWKIYRGVDIEASIKNSR